MARFSGQSVRARLTLSASGLLIALLIVEGVLRIMPPLGPEFVLAATVGELDNRAFRDDVELRVVLAPSVAGDGFTTNSLGIRGPELGEKGPHERRVLAIGDSFTLGMQVSDTQTFSALLDQSLGASTRILNAGVPGYGTDQAIGLMKRLVPVTRADAVLLTVYSGNDLRDNDRWSRSPGLPTTPPPVRAPPPQRSKLVKTLGSVSRVVAYALLYADLDRLGADFRIDEFRDEVAPFADAEALDPIIGPTARALQRYRDACRDLDVVCGLALVPPAYVVHTERQKSTFDAFGLALDPAQIERPAAAILGAVPSSISTIDLTAALRAGAEHRPYLVFDPHFSAAGHRIVADQLTPFVRTLLETP